MITIFIYLKRKRKPFEICFESRDKYYVFLETLYANDIITIGPLTFAKTEFRYFIQK